MHGASVMKPSMPSSPATRGLFLGVVFLASAALGGVLSSSEATLDGASDAARSAPAAPADEAERAPRRLVIASEPLPQAPPPVLGAFAFDDERQRFVAPWGEHRAVLTLHPRLQKALSEALEQGRPQRGATVLLEAGTGRVLALAGYEDGRGSDEEIALRAFAPAASIFKVPSTAALLRAGVKPDDPVCYFGGKRRLQPKHLEDDPRRDRCVHFRDVLPFSLNAAVAKLVDKRLPAGALEAEARRFGFDRKLLFARPTETSLAHIPADRFERANAAAGFGDVRISALHGALIASIPANDGMLLWPRVIDELSGGEPRVPPSAERALPAELAKELARLMARTVDEGTGWRTFSERGPSLAGVRVAGKTGSLTDYEGGADYSWFVGYAPVDNPRVIVAAVIENDIQLWYVRAPEMAREALERAFEMLGKEALARSPHDDGTRTR